MNKKLLFPVLMIAFALVFPGLVSAQPLQCCKLRARIEFENATYNSGIWVGEAANLNCDGIVGNEIGSTVCNDSGGNSGSCFTPKWGILCMLNSVVTITNWVFYGLLAVSALLVIFGGFTISTAGGDPSNVEKGKNYIVYAMIGLAIALMSRAIPAIVKALL